MKLIEATFEDMKRLYKGSAWTWEGTTIDKTSLEFIVSWFKEKGCPLRNEEFYLINGGQMNWFCGGLTGSNAYKNDLNILAIELKNIPNVEKLYMKKFEVGARWFNDIVDNNRRREEDKNELS